MALVLSADARDALRGVTEVMFCVKHADIGFEKPIVSCQDKRHVVCPNPKYVFDLPKIAAEDKEFIIDENGHNKIRVPRNGETSFVLTFSCISSEKTNQVRIPGSTFYRLKLCMIILG